MSTSSMKTHSDVACTGAIEAQAYGYRRLNESFCEWVDKMEGELADVCSLDGKAREAACCRVGGPRFSMKPALGEVASQFPRVAPVTAAWRAVAAWLLKLLQAFTAAQTPGKPRDDRTLCCICQIVRRFRQHRWADLGAQGDTEAFRHWFGGIQHHLITHEQAVRGLVAAGSAAEGKSC